MVALESLFQFRQFLFLPPLLVAAAVAAAAPVLAAPQILGPVQGLSGEVHER